MTEDQIHIAMALLKLTVKSLADATQLAPGTIMRVRDGLNILPENMKTIKGYLESEGIIFIDKTLRHKATAAMRE